MIKLFDVFMAQEAIGMLAETLARRPDGMIYVGEGARVAQFEQELQTLLGLDRPLLAMNSCTSALDMALHLCGVRPGDVVISTPMTCTATNGVIVNRHARIVWADVDPKTGLIDPADVARKVTRETKAIMAVDWGGRLCDYPALKIHNIPVIQDAAHSLLAGVGGDYVCWSFQAIKHLTTGDGGALLTPPEQHDRARLLRWYGLDRRSSADFRCSQTITEAGYKYHMNDIAAAIGLANLKHVAENIRLCRANAEWYNNFLCEVPGVQLPAFDPLSSWWLYTVLVNDTKGFIEFLRDHGVAASQVHRRNDLHPAFHFPSGPLQGVDAFAEREVAIPVGWWLTPQEKQIVGDAVREWASG